MLRSIDSAPQLKIIEKNSPHICYEDQELWKKLITKDFGPGALSKFKLEDNNRWSALYDVSIPFSNTKTMTNKEIEAP